MSKICSKCGIEKDESEFYFRKENGTYRTACKSCLLSQQATNRATNCETTRECLKCKVTKQVSEFHKYKEGYQKHCKNCRREYATTTYSTKRKKYLEKYYKIKKGQLPPDIPKTTEQLEAEAAEIHPVILERNRNRRATTPTLRLADNIRRRVNSLLYKLRIGKSANTQKLLGADFATVKLHIEALFTEGMTWEKLGKEIHIDHIRPCASFDLTDPEQQKQCFHYTNLQPLWAKDNISKHSLWNGVRHSYGDSDVK